MFVCFSAIAAFAQTGQFDGAQRPVALGFYEPQCLAVDRNGNLFVADADTFLISEILAVNGAIPPNPTIRVLYRDTWNPEAIAVDGSGNVFFADYNDMNPPNGQTIKEILAVNGSIPASPTVVQLGSGFSFPQGLAVDANGNVYVSDTSKSGVLEMLAVNGSVPSSPTIITLGSGFSAPQAVTVDSAGDVYVADSGNHAVKEIVAVNGSIPASPTILTLASNYCAPNGLSLDSQGNLYFSDYCNAAIYEIQAVNGSIPPSPVTKTFSSGAGLGGVTDVAVDSSQNVYAGGVFSATQIPQVFPSDFGAVNVGTTTAATSLMFTFIGPVTLGSVSVYGMDFTDSGTGTCVAGGYYNSPSSYSLCTVDLTFAPKFAGTRSGAVLLKDPTGKTIATGFVNGTGVAPLTNFAPPTLSTAVSGVVWAGGVATDTSGNLYVSIPGQNQVVKETYSSGSYTQTVLPTSSLNFPQGVAVDGAGNVFIADTGNYRVLKETPTVGGYFESVVASNIGGSPGTGPIGVAVDGHGSAFILTMSGMLYIKNPIYGSLNVFPVGLASASGLAVDASGKVYIVANTTSGSIVVETPSGNSYLGSNIPVPAGGVLTGVAVDSWGNVYVTYVVTGGQQSQVLKASPTSGGYVLSTIVSGGLDEPFGLAVDPNGNLFVADSGNYRILKVDSSDPPTLTFTSTSVGATSADSPQTVTLTNVGNADLEFPIPTSGNNPSISTNFTVDENAPSACPVIGSGSPTAGVLAAGASCVLPISFAPTATGSFSGSLVLTDNNLNAPAPVYATQTISLTGTATLGTPTITWSAPVSITYGTSLSSTQLNANANVPGTFSYSPAAGTVLHAGTQSLTVTFTPTDTTDYTTATKTVPLTVNKATPVLSWPTPAPIIYGTALSTTQLNATANVPGTFTYTPPAGTVLNVGSNTLSVTFTPTDSTDYTTASASVSLMVNNVQYPPTPITLDGSNHCTSGGANVSSVSCTLSNVSAGDLITVEFSDRNGYETSISDGVNGTYGKIYYVPDSGDPNYSGMAYFANSKAGSLTIKLALSKKDPWAKISVQAWKGAATTAVLDQSAITQHLTSTAGTVANSTCGSAQNPGTAGELILAYLVGDNDTSVTAGANYTIIDANSNSDNPSFPEYWIQTTASPTNGPFISAPDDFTEGCAAFRPAPTTPTPITLDGSNHCTSGGANVSSVSCTLSNVSAGDLITVEFSDRNGYETSISDAANGTYGKIYYVPDSGDPNYSGMAYLANSKAGSLTVKLAMSRSDPWAKISVQAWKGAATTAVLDQSAITQHLTSTSGTVANSTCGSAQNPGTAGELILAYLVGDNDTSVTAGANYTIIDANSNSDNPSFPEYWIQTTASPTNGPFISAPDDFTEGCAAFKPS